MFIVFIFISVIYYIPAYIFSKIAIKQIPDKEYFQKKNSEINGSQNFLISLIYIILIGEIGYRLCTTYLTVKNGLVEDSSVFFFLVLFVPIINQFLSSIVFLPRYWNPHNRGADRKNLLIIFFLSNLFYSFKIVGLFLNNVHSMGGFFFIFLALPALPSYYVMLLTVARESKHEELPYQDTSKFKFEDRTKALSCFILFYIVLNITNYSLLFFKRTKLGISSNHALNISKDDLLTNEKYILGEDKNNNQIRDDYEDWVQKNYVDYDEKMAMLQFGRSHFLFMEATITGLKNIKGQKKLESYNFEAKDSELVKYFSDQHGEKSRACLDYVFEKEGMEIEDLWAIRKKATSVLLNNADRYHVDKIGNFSGGVLLNQEYEGCNFIIKKGENKNEIAFRNLRNKLIISIENKQLENVKKYCNEVQSKILEDEMIEEISTTALLKKDTTILNTLYDCGFNLRKRNRNLIYSDISLNWINSKYD